MKAEINCPILTNEKFSKEVLGDLVSSLEQLENTKATIFNRLNSAIAERVNKLCNIKARINRANQIISNYSSINEAITIKSKKHYPSQKHNYYTSMIIDKNATTLSRPPQEKINRIVLNEKENLGFKSLAAKEKIVTYDKFLSYATQFNDVVNTLDKVIAQENSIRQCMDDFGPILKHVTNDFSLANKNKIETAKKQLAFPRTVSTSISRIGSTATTEFFIDRKSEEKKKKVIQQAPKSIIEKTKLKKYKKKKKYLATNNTAKINFNLPTNIGLGNVTDLADNDDEEDKIEQEKSEDEDDDDYDDDKDDVQTDPQIQDQQEINVDLPIDLIRYNNETKTFTNKIPKTNINNNSQNTQNNNNSQQNTENSNQNTNTNDENTQSTPTPPPQQVNNNVQINTPPVNNQSNSNVVFVSESSTPGPPPPPPPPMIKIEFNPEFEKKAKENEEKEKNEPKEKKEEIENTNGGEELSMADQLAQSMAKLKKTGEVKVKEPEKPKELSLADQIALSRSKLKKTVEVNQKPPEKKKVNGMDLLSAQIRLRFQNLRMHEDDNDKDDDSDDSF